MNSQLKSCTWQILCTAVLLIGLNGLLIQRARATDTGELNITSYANLNAAVASIGSTVATLVISSPTTTTANLVVPSNISIRMLNSGSIDRSLYTLAINGPFHAGLHRVFLGSGTLTFSAKVTYVAPQWWGAVGDGGTNDTDAVQDALATGHAVVELSGYTYKIASGLSIAANQELRNGVLNASTIASGAAVTVTGAVGDSGAIPSRRVLSRIKLVLHDNPSNGVHSTTTDGVKFQSTLNVATEYLTVVGARYGVTYGSNSWAVTHHSPVFWYCGRAVSADQNGLSNMGAGLWFYTPQFLHCDFAVYNRLCQIMMINPSFDSAVYGYIEDNITSSSGVHNSEMVIVNPRFESGGNTSYPWIKNSGYMTMRNLAIYEPMTCSYLIDNSGQITIDGGFTRVTGDDYKARNTDLGRISVNGIKLCDASGGNLRFTRAESRIFNNGIETGTTAGYTITGGTGSIAAVTTNPAPYAGAYALNITNGSGSASTFRVDGIPLTPGKSTMHLTVMYRASVQRALVFEFYNASGLRIENTWYEYLNVSGGWTRLRRVQTIPAGAAYMKMRVDLSGSETISFDEFYLSEW